MDKVFQKQKTGKYAQKSALVWIIKNIFLQGSEFGKTMTKIRIKPSVLLAAVYISLGLFLPLFADKSLVFQTDTGIPVTNAAVFIEGLQIQYTDKEGRVNITALNPASLLLNVTMALTGFEVLEASADFSARDEIIFTLHSAKAEVSSAGKKAKRMQEVYITSTKDGQGSVTLRTRISAQDISRTSQHIIGDVTKTLQTMPGVSSSGSTFDSKMYIQGGSEWEYLAAMDGVLVLAPSYWGGAVSIFNPNTVESVDLYTAGYPARYAQGLSGIIDVNVRSGHPDKWSGFIDLAGSAAETRIAGHLGKKVTVFMNMRRTYYDWIMNQLYGNNTEGVQFPYIWDGVFKMNAQIGSKDTLSFMTFGSQEGMKWKLDLEMGEASGEPPDLSGWSRYKNSQIIGKLAHTHRLRGTDKIETVLSITPHFGNGSATVTGTPGTPSDYIVNGSWKQEMYYYQLSSFLNINSPERHKIDAGIFAMYINSQALEWKYDIYYLSRSNWTNTVDEMKYNDRDENYYSAYAQDDIRILPGLYLQIGGRFDYQTMTKHRTFSPRGGIKFELSPELDIYARSGIYYAHVMNLTYVDPSRGNPHLKPEQAIHYCTGVDFGNRLLLARVEGYFKQYDRLVESDLTNKYLNSGKREAFGASVYFQKRERPQDWVNGWISYSYCDAKEKIFLRERGDYGETAPPELEWFTPSYLRRHTGSCVLEVRYARKNQRKWEKIFLGDGRISLDFRYLSGKPYTPATNVMRYEIPGEGTHYTIQYGKYNSARTSDFHKLDLRITLPNVLLWWVDLASGGRVKSSTYVSFINIYNNRNIMSYSYYVDPGVKKNDKKGADIRIPRTESLGASALLRKDVLDFPFMFMGGFRVEF
ncbi:MAG: hypothetical protein A2096_10295 [Spirochaetes bacterium GWF1_41_5]|nr:MAG: hypothetical protein A2096_10295 [Spirochaetes bacterium GWF1_41_5]